MHAIDRLLDLLNTIPDKLCKISNEQFFSKPSPAKWSKKEILGHLVDSAFNNHQRFVRTQYEQVPSISYNQDEWVRINNWQNRPVEQIISMWCILNQNIIEVFSIIPDEKLSLLCHNGKENKTLQFLIDDYVDHMEHHLRQIIT